MVHGAALRKGTSRSCRSCASTTHGLSTTPTYRVWRGMRQRCTNRRHKNFHLYGGCGITVCDRWYPRKGGSFANFLADVKERPGSGYQLGRIDNEKRATSRRTCGGNQSPRTSGTSAATSTSTRPTCGTCSQRSNKVSASCGPMRSATYGRPPTRRMSGSVGP